MQMPRSDEAIDLATQAAADSLILGGANRQETAAFLAGMPPGRSADAIAALLSPWGDAPRRFAADSSLILGSWLSARLSARGYTPAPEPRAAMYALADAARMLALVELLRWQTVVAAMPTPPHLESVRDRLLSQSRTMLRTLARLSDSNDLRHEHRVLKCLRDKP